MRAIRQRVRPYDVQMNNSLTQLPPAQQPRTRRGCVGILGDGYRRKIPLPSVQSYPSIPSHGQSTS